MSGWRRTLARFTTLVIASVIALAGAEVFVRTIDGYALSSVTLVRDAHAATPAVVPGGKLLDSAAVAPLIAGLPLAPATQREWFALEPPGGGPLPVDPELDRRYWRHRGHELESVYQWNRNYVRDAVCARGDVDRAVFSHLDDVYVFDPPANDSRPSYRFLPSTHYPSGLRTNAFGWRGREIDPAKPANKLRVAFVGASTTIAAHQDPFSYPEYVGRWLEEWVTARHPGLSVDVINAGREGVDSASIAAIVEHELLPLAPDVVVYYEGANQFWPSNFVVNHLPLRLLRTMRAPQWMATHSALVGRLLQVARRAAQDGREPAKPPLWVRWPADLDERDPLLDDPRLPVQLPAILGDLDRIRRMLAAHSRVLAVSSFVWLVHDGLVLDPARDAFLFDYLNDAYWPFPYAHVRRYVDFENRVFRKFATEHGLPFVDPASAFPADPRLFVDGIHMTAGGVKLHAWLVFQQLVPFLETAITNGDLPREGPTDPLATTPQRERRLIRIDEIRAACPQPS